MIEIKISNPSMKWIFCSNDMILDIGVQHSSHASTLVNGPKIINKGEMDDRQPTYPNGKMMYHDKKPTCLNRQLDNNCSWNDCQKGLEKNGWKGGS